MNQSILSQMPIQLCQGELEPHSLWYLQILGSTYSMSPYCETMLHELDPPIDSQCKALDHLGPCTLDHCNRLTDQTSTWQQLAGRTSRLPVMYTPYTGGHLPPVPLYLK